MGASPPFPQILPILLANNKMELFESSLASAHYKDEEPNKIKH